MGQGPGAMPPEAWESPFWSLGSKFHFWPPRVLFLEKIFKRNLLQLFSGIWVRTSGPRGRGWAILILRAPTPIFGFQDGSFEKGFLKELAPAFPCNLGPNPSPRTPPPLTEAKAARQLTSQKIYTHKELAAKVLSMINAIWYNYTCYRIYDIYYIIYCMIYHTWYIIQDIWAIVNYVIEDNWFPGFPDRRDILC